MFISHVIATPYCFFTFCAITSRTTKKKKKKKKKLEETLCLSTSSTIGHLLLCRLNNLLLCRFNKGDSHRVPYCITFLTTDYPRSVRTAWINNLLVVAMFLPAKTGFP